MTDDVQVRESVKFFPWNIHPCLWRTSDLVSNQRHHSVKDGWKEAWNFSLIVLLYGMVLFCGRENMFLVIFHITACTTNTRLDRSMIIDEAASRQDKNLVQRTQFGKFLKVHSTQRSLVLKHFQTVEQKWREISPMVPSF